MKNSVNPSDRKISRAKKLESDPKYFKNKKLLERYKITIIEFERLLKSQKNCCAICKIHLNERDKLTTPYLDHDHQTQIIRGILCLNCNTLISRARENTEILRRAISYLNQH